MKLDFENKVLPGLRYLTQAGGQLPTRIKTKIVRSCKRNGVKFYCMYGQTEAAPRMGYLPWENVEKAGCIGIPVPSGRFWLVDDTGTVIDSDDVVGELVYQGPNVSLGYAESAEDLSRADENRGVLMTGDLAKRDREGFYYLVGRKSRFVKLYGNRIDLDSLETLISSNDCDCACVAQMPRVHHVRCLRPSRWRERTRATSASSMDIATSCSSVNICFLLRNQLFGLGLGIV